MELARELGEFLPLAWWLLSYAVKITEDAGNTSDGVLECFTLQQRHDFSSDRSGEDNRYS
jgi:hypothetical protein